MNARLEQLRESLREGLARARAGLAGHRGWVEGGVLTLCALLALLAWGRAAHEESRELQAQAREMEAIRARMDAIRDGFVPAAPPESLLWRESETAIASLSRSRSPDPLAVSRLVALRAEESGLSNVRIRLIGADSAAAFPTTAVGPFVMSPGERAIGIEFTGRWDTVIGLIGSLPTEVEIGHLELVALPGDAMRARLVLLTRHLQRAG